jgi:D-glycero-D-manno-heptose 1,7-bisphosphate phosphatase
MKKELQKEGIYISKTYFCPHSPSQKCDCRKPSPKMILEAAKEFGIDLKNSWFFGDKETDIQAATKAGITNTVLVLCGHKKDTNTKASYIANDLLDGLNRFML